MARAPEAINHRTAIEITPFIALSLIGLSGFCLLLCRVEAALFLQVEVQELRAVLHIFSERSGFELETAATDGLRVAYACFVCIFCSSRLKKCNEGLISGLYGMSKRYG